ncbi:hypothetical protein [Stigmatella erecta]|uniref:hypothetical protein n=1 Tax=Stigmatella erecta TaxID=83460 RepID=UPI001FE4A735|nr:hypothetical protein [Stigmatella erecta]
MKAQACPPGVASRTRVVNPPGTQPYTLLEGLTDVQGTLYFTVPWGGGTVLWRSNGTETGTVQVKVFPEGVFPDGAPAALGNTLFVPLYDRNTGMTQLWASDGTSSGTRLVKDFTPGFYGDSLRSMATLNGRLVFFHETLQGTEVWSSDGTSQGTVVVANFPDVLNLYYNSIFQVGNALLFFRSQGGPTTLWRTDGTQAGTFSLKHLDAERVFTSQVSLAKDEGLFILDDGPNREVWKTDGTAAGTLRLDTFGGYPILRLLGRLGSKAYVASYAHLYSLSLSGGGRTLVTTLPVDNEDESPQVLRATISGEAIYFSVAITTLSSWPSDVRLWVTNGTAKGTRELRRLLPGTDMNESPVFATGTGSVLFLKSNGTDNTSRPWFTQGTAATTGQLANVNVRMVDGLGPEPFVRAGNRVFFPATDDTGLEQLWSVPATFTCPPGLTEPL